MVVKGSWPKDYVVRELVMADIPDSSRRSLTKPNTKFWKTSSGRTDSNPASDESHRHAYVTSMKSRESCHFHSQAQRREFYAYLQSFKTSMIPGWEQNFHLFSILRFCVKLPCNIALSLVQWPFRIMTKRNSEIKINDSREFPRLWLLVRRTILVKQNWRVPWG